MKIGEVAKKVGITVEAIRFYEKKKLVDEPLRNGSGYRDYPEGVVSLLLFVKRSKALGFSLKEINELLALCRVSGATCGDIREQAVAKIEDIDRRVDDLQRIKTALADLVSTCPGQGPLSECPIVGSLNIGRQMK